MKSRTLQLCAALIGLLILAGGYGCAEGPSGTPVATPTIITRVVNAVAAGDWNSIAPLMTPDMAALITPASSQQVTEGFAILGSVESISTLSEPSQAGGESYSFTVHQSKGDTAGALSLDSDGKIAALEFHPRQRGATSVDRSAYITRGDVHLPFHGEWYAFWGGIDPATNTPHAQAGGSERYAYDMVIVKDGATHAGAGAKNSDYYCYGQPILSPVAGTVVTVVDGVPQNTPGVMNTMFVPGNCVVIGDGLGEYFALMHLQPHRMEVKVGDRVAAGQVIGYCGNSGNASEPHLHFQMADGPDIATANGLPITFHHFLQDGKPVESAVALGKVSLANQGTFHPADSSH